MAKTKNREFIIRKNMTFAEIIKRKPEAVEILLKKGLHCIGCHMAFHETLEQGALMHGLDPKEIVKELNKKSRKNGKKRKN